MVRDRIRIRRQVDCKESMLWVSTNADAIAQGARCPGSRDYAVKRYWDSMATLFQTDCLSYETFV